VDGTALEQQVRGGAVTAASTAAAISSTSLLHCSSVNGLMLAAGAWLLPT